MRDWQRNDLVYEENIYNFFVSFEVFALNSRHIFGTQPPRDVTRGGRGAVRD